MKIMSFDGGGIRGLVSLYYLKKLLNVKPDLIEKTDFFAGTSTGGIIAIGLALGKSVDELIELYEKSGPNIFKDSFFDNLKDGFGLKGAQYPNKELKKELIKILGAETRVKDLKKKILIPAFSLDSEASVNRSWEPVFFDNFDCYHQNELLWEIALRTSAAPTFFPLYGKYADGGLFANNPSMCAIAQTNFAPDIELMSFGCGKTLQHLESRNKDWGLVGWGPILIEVMFGAAVDTVDYQCEKFLGDRYVRVDPILDKAYKLDDVKQIPEMKKWMDNWPIEGQVQTFLESRWN